MGASRTMWRIVLAVVLVAGVSSATATARLVVPSTCSVIPGMAVNLPSIKFYASITDTSTCCILCTDYKSCAGTVLSTGVQVCEYCGAFTANASGCTLTRGGTGTKMRKEDGATSGVNSNDAQNTTVAWSWSYPGKYEVNMMPSRRSKYDAIETKEYIPPCRSGGVVNLALGENLQTASCNGPVEYYYSSIFCKLTADGELTSEVLITSTDPDGGYGYDISGPSVTQGCSVAKPDLNERFGIHGQCCFGHGNAIPPAQEMLNY